MALRQRGASPFLLPVAAAQAVRLRATTPVLPPAGGPTTGLLGPADGCPIQVAVVGESTAAGCGVDSHADGFAGSLAREIVDRAGRSVSWQVVGRYGATARRIRHTLVPQLGPTTDVGVLLAGVNDVLTARPPRDWRADLDAIVRELAVRCRVVVVAGLPPFEAFPAVPRTLRGFLAHRARQLDEVAREVCSGHGRATWVAADVLLPVSDDFFASDRFHPSAVGYRRWATAVADQIPVRDL